MTAVQVRSEGWRACAFPGEFRGSQALALDAVERLRAAGRRHAYVVLPPGAGKTVLGLEIARRAGRRTLVLTPNTAVQEQWLAAWDRFAPDGACPVPAGSDRSLEAPLTVLTYRSLSAWDRTADDEDAEDVSSPAVAARRRAAVRGDAGADLLDLLHPAGRETVERAAGLGPWTLVLDECHHLLETWGALVPALARRLDAEVLGLTATPPSELTARPRALYDQLFGGCGVAVPLPQAVKEGELAPYQELVYLTAPTAEEDGSIAAERTRFAELATELLERRAGTLPFAEWLRRRVHERPAGDDGAQPSWRELEREEPELARATLRLAGGGRVEPPAGARQREEHEVPPDADDWAVLLAGYANEHLVPSDDADDQRLLTAIRAVLPGLGWTLTMRGLRAAPSPVDRVCALSAAKAAAAVHILSVESAALGEHLRAVVLCDIEAGTDSAPGSARLALTALAGGELGPVLRPVLVTGRTVAMRREDVAAFRASPAVRAAGLSDRLVAEPLDGVRSLVRLTAGDGWSARVWTPLVTAWLVAGGTRAVVGTRGLLGEGWDCPPLNVVVDLSGATTAGPVTSVRGRSLRLDPERPDKVADNWTVVCLADGHPRGDADYLRAARKHAAHLAPGAGGEIEAGLGHCDEVLSPYAPPAPAERPAVNARALARAADRTSARQAWAAGSRYTGVELSTLRVRFGRALGLPAGVVPAGLLAPRTVLGTDGPPRPGRESRSATAVPGRSEESVVGRSRPSPLGRSRAWPLWPVPAGTGAVAAGFGLTASLPAGVGAGAGTAVLVGAAAAGTRYRQQAAALRDAPPDAQTATLRQLAAAVADALHAAGGTSAGAAAVTVRGGAGGWLTCVLDAPPEESALFAACLDELLAPLAEPRWLVSRLVLRAPESARDCRRLAVARALGRRVEASVAWHAVPSWVGRRKDRVAGFDAAWQRHLGAGRLVRARDPEGAALLDLLRGADPFAVTSRLRTVWR